jgi:ribulose 1,5-bisphosphate carboxylase large subunit-like protein
MAMRQALDAGVAGIAIEEYAEEHNALRVAIGKWR